MRLLKVFTVVILFSGLISMLICDARAETRQLRTVLVITVKSATPQVASAPSHIQESLDTAYDQSSHERFVKFDTVDHASRAMPRYSMMEKL